MAGEVRKPPMPRGICMTVAGTTGSNGAIHLQIGEVQSHQAGLSPKCGFAVTPSLFPKGKLSKDLAKFMQLLM